MSEFDVGLSQFIYFLEQNNREFQNNKEVCRYLSSNWERIRGIKLEFIILSEMFLWQFKNFFFGISRYT